MGFKISLALGAGYAAIWVATSVLSDGVTAINALTDTAGDPENGLLVLRDSSKASCLICHNIPSLPDRDQGRIGPFLDGVATRYSEHDLRLRLIDARHINEKTVMPPYFSIENLFRVGQKWQGKTIYTAQEVEDVLAYLMGLGD